MWPHFTSLGQWLGQNPNCEPVKPGSPHAQQLMNSVSNKKNSQLQSPTSSTVITSTSHTPSKHHIQLSPGDELFSNPIKISTGNKDSPVIIPTTTASVRKTSLTSQGHHSGNSTSVRSNISTKNSSGASTAKPPLIKSTSVSSSSSSATSNKTMATSTPKTHEVKKLKRQTSDEKLVHIGTNSSTKSKVEFERMNVRINLKRTLQQRMDEFEHPTISKMTENEVEKFTTSVEAEMFIYFNKDTREKYKIKFRSLKFNLSDTKNKTLLEKICAKKLSAKQLVELPSSALASDELAKWREDENKHQLEIITKAELDALAQNKIVLKSHKGEEIIETTSAQTNISLPDEEDDEDVESVIAKTVLTIDDPHGRYDLSRSISLNVSGSHSVSSPLSSPSISSSTGRKSDLHHDSRSRSKSRGRSDHHHHHHHHSKSSTSSSKHKKSERHRSRSRSPRHHGSHFHSRDKSRERRSRDKSQEQDHGKKRSNDHKHRRDKSRSNEKDKSRDHQKETSKDSKRHHHQPHSKDHNKDHKESVKVEKMEIKPEQEDVDIVGKILDSMGVHLDTKPKQELSSEEKPIATAEIKPEVSLSITEAPSTEPINEHQLAIEIYSGNMYMADVTKFDVTASIVSGNVDDIVKLFTPQLECVGRIEPKTVWDYLGKVKKLPGKELAVLRFSSTDESAYFTLFSYLHSRQRYGVIKSPSPHIKDFYLITVEAKRPLPQVLLPIVGPGFVEGDEHKPDLLLGIILKIQPETKVDKFFVKKNP